VFEQAVAFLPPAQSEPLMVAHIRFVAETDPKRAKKLARSLLEV
jgi:hypothetical protein